MDRITRPIERRRGDGFAIKLADHEDAAAYIAWEDWVGLKLRKQAPAAQKYITGEDLTEAFCRTILVGNVAPSENIQVLTTENRVWSTAERSLIDQQRTIHIHHRSALGRSIYSGYLHKGIPPTFIQRIKASVARTFVPTEKRYMGLVSGQVKVGDQIWLLKGSKVPIVLRKCENNETWIVIGDAYIHGIMYGEAFEEDKCEQIVLV